MVNNDKIIKLFLSYKNKKDNKELINIQENGTSVYGSNKYIIDEVNLFKAKDNKFYIRIGCTSTRKYEPLKKYIYIDEKNKIISFAEYQYRNNETYIAYLETEEKYRGKGLISNAVLKIEDLSRTYNKGKPISLLCMRRSDDKNDENRNLKLYEHLGYEIEPGELRNSEYIKMKKFPMDKEKRKLINNKNNNLGK